MNKGENMKNNNGFTMIELVVSFSLTMIVIVYLLKTIVVISNKNQELLTLQEYEVLETTLLSKINEDIKNQNGNVEILEKNESIFISGIEEYITFNNNENYITYKDIIYELPDGVKIADVPYTISNIKDGNMISSNTSFNVAKINLIVNNKDRKVIISNQYYDDTVEKKSCYYTAGVELNFDYTGGEQKFSVPCSGVYKVEVWGAQGGSIGSYTGGYGGYSSGEIRFEKGTELFVYVGGSTTGESGGYNGGGDGISNGTGGGGATHIATVSGKLSKLNLSENSNNILIVAGGGGGSVDYGSAFASGSGGNAGGYTGNNGNKGSWASQAGIGGNQMIGGNYGLCSDGTQCGSQGEFGIGGSYISCSTSNCATNYQAGGGGGFYGGGSARHAGGGGGSGYIGNSSLINKEMYCYGCTESNEESTKTISTTNVSNEPISGYAKQGNGYAKITYIGE